MNDDVLVAKRVEELDWIMERVNTTLERARRLHIDKLAEIDAVLRVASNRVRLLHEMLERLKERLARALPEFEAARERLRAAVAARKESERRLADAEAHLRAAVAARERDREAARGENGGDGSDGGGGSGESGSDRAVEVAESLVQACQADLEARRADEAEAARQEERWRKTVEILKSQIEIHAARHDEAKEVEKALAMRYGLVDAEGKQHLREARDRIQEERLARLKEILTSRPL